MTTSFRQEEISRQVQDTVARLQLQDEAIHYFQSSAVEIERMIAHFESQYGVLSSQVHDEIEQGRLVESEDVCDWIMNYELLQRIKGA